MHKLHIYATAYAFAQCVPFFLYAVGFAYGGYLITIDLMVPLDVYRYHRDLFKKYITQTRVFFAIAFCGVAFGQVSSFIPDIVKARVSAAHLFRMIETPSYIDPLDGKGLKPVRHSPTKQSTLAVHRTSKAK